MYPFECSPPVGAFSCLPTSACYTCMSNDTNRLLQYMYGELDEIEAEQMEQALAHRPDLFDVWFAFHEVKHELDAQAPPHPDAAVVDEIVGHARRAAALDAAPTRNADDRARGDGVPQHDARTRCTVTIPADRRAERTACDPSSAHGATSTRATAASQMRTGAAVPWALMLVLAVVLLLRGGPGASGPDGSASPHTPVADLPAWDAPNERVALHRQAAVLQARMPALSMSASSTSLSSVSHSVTR